MCGCWPAGSTESSDVFVSEKFDCVVITNQRWRVRDERRSGDAQDHACTVASDVRTLWTSLMLGVDAGRRWRVCIATAVWKCSDFPHTCIRNVQVRDCNEKKVKYEKSCNFSGGGVGGELPLDPTGGFSLDRHHLHRQLPRPPLLMKNVKFWEPKNCIFNWYIMTIKRNRYNVSSETPCTPSYLVMGVIEEIGHRDDNTECIIRWGWLTDCGALACWTLNSVSFTTVVTHVLARNTAHIELYDMKWRQLALTYWRTYWLVKSQNPTHIPLWDHTPPPQRLMALSGKRIWRLWDKPLWVSDEPYTLCRRCAAGASFHTRRILSSLNAANCKQHLHWPSRVASLLLGLSSGGRIYGVKYYVGKNSTCFTTTSSALSACPSLSADLSPCTGCYKLILLTLYGGPAAAVR